MVFIWLVLLFSIIHAEACRESTVYSYECMVNASSLRFGSDNIRLVGALLGHGDCGQSEPKVVETRGDLRVFTEADIAASAIVYQKTFTCRVCQCANGGDARRDWPDKLDCMSHNHPLKNQNVSDLCQKYAIVIQPDGLTLTADTTTAAITTAITAATITTASTVTPTCATVATTTVPPKSHKSGRPYCQGIMDIENYCCWPSLAVLVDLGKCIQKTGCQEWRWEYGFQNYTVRSGEIQVGDVPSAFWDNLDPVLPLYFYQALDGFSKCSGDYNHYRTGINDERGHHCWECRGKPNFQDLFKKGLTLHPDSNRYVPGYTCLPDQC